MEVEKIILMMLVELRQQRDRAIENCNRLLAEVKELKEKEKKDE